MLAVKARGAPTVLPSTVRMIRPGAFGRACAASYATMERSARIVDCVDPKRPLLFDSTIHFKPFSTCGGISRFAHPGQHGKRGRFDGQSVAAGAGNAGDGALNIPGAFLVFWTSLSINWRAPAWSPLACKNVRCQSNNVAVLR